MICGLRYDTAEELLGSFAVPDDFCEYLCYFALLLCCQQRQDTLGGLSPMEEILGREAP